jgi:hypothetical protein
MVSPDSLPRISDCVWKPVTLSSTVCPRHLGPPFRCPIPQVIVNNLYDRVIAEAERSRHVRRQSATIVAEARSLIERLARVRRVG